MITGGVNSLVIDDQPKQSYASADSSDEDIFLTDNEEVEETIPVVSPIVGNKLTESTEKRILSENFSNVSQHERVDKELECDLDGDESLNQESSSIISSIIEDLLRFVVLVPAKDESFNLDDGSSCGEESFGECWEEYEDDEDSDMLMRTVKVMMRRRAVMIHPGKQIIVKMKTRRKKKSPKNLE